MDNLRFFAALQGVCGRAAEERASEVLRCCGASQVQGTRVDRLSDGFVARVTLARALLHDPDLLVLDEPARSVDPATRPLLLQGIRDFVSRPGKAAVMVTHELGDVFEICGRVAVMRGACIRAA
jgi:ABC-type multidrug transport system ATPase subunit